MDDQVRTNRFGENVDECKNLRTRCISVHLVMNGLTVKKSQTHQVKIIHPLRDTKVYVGNQVIVNYN